MTNATGSKAQGGNKNRKEWVIRHGRSSRRCVNAAEKAIEVKVRQAGRKACKEVF